MMEWNLKCTGKFFSSYFQESFKYFDHSWSVNKIAILLYQVNRKTFIDKLKSMQINSWNTNQHIIVEPLLAIYQHNTEDCRNLLSIGAYCSVVYVGSAQWYSMNYARPLRVGWWHHEQYHSYPGQPFLATT